MAFTFEITHISRLAWAQVGVLDGKLLDGVVLIGAKAQLLHEGQHFPISVKGVVLDSVPPGTESLSLTVDLREAAIKVAAAGDKLVCA
ncbi:hypothetical protein GTP45_02745 [Pseudoduganella sp. FT55W]|uniref:Uncharacterized protein n=1 Tax=Duganella rivi TaxID=2666083 RepID=A0A7X4K990_9BURK|nr:hypothetical protein [Duganella rivi]MYM65751.1 hypothetical protein [Duganella rivi]